MMLTQVQNTSRAYGYCCVVKLVMSNNDNMSIYVRPTFEFTNIKTVAYITFVKVGVVRIVKVDGWCMMSTIAVR